MNRDSLISKLKSIEDIVRGCLSELGKTSSQSAKESAPAHAVSRSAASSLPGYILALRDAKFFRQAKTANEVHEKLQPTYGCAPNRVFMALKRLMERKQLRKTSKKVDKKNQVAYVW
jgi:hypothetical protein